MTRRVQRFFDTTVQPTELELLRTTLETWRKERDLPEDDPVVEIAAVVIINLFREGNRSRAALEAAMAGHKALRDLAPLLESP